MLTTGTVPVDDRVTVSGKLEEMVGTVETGDGAIPSFLTLARNTDENEYLAIYVTGDRSIEGLLLDRDGDVVSGPTVLVDRDGPAPFPTSGGVLLTPPNVAYNPETQQYAITFDRRAGSRLDGPASQSSHVVARLVSDTAQPMGGEVRITPDLGAYDCAAGAADIEFDPGAGGYVVASTQSREAGTEPGVDCPGIAPATTNQRTIVQPVGADLAPGPLTRVPDQGDAPRSRFVDVEVHPADGSFLVVGATDRTTGTAYVDEPDLTLRRRIELTSESSGEFGGDAAAADPVTGNWLITWAHGLERSQYATVVDIDGETLAVPSRTISSRIGPVRAVGDGTFVAVGASPPAFLHLDAEGFQRSTEQIDRFDVGSDGSSAFAGIEVEPSAGPPRAIAIGRVDAVAIATTEVFSRRGRWWSSFVHGPPIRFSDWDGA